MKETNDKDIDLVKAAYEQHYLHVRHAANVRLWFINIFAIIFAGSLAALGDKLFDTSKNIYSLPLIIFLMALSIFEILFGLKINSIIRAHSNSAEQILKTYGLSDLLPRYKENWVKKNIRVSGLFLIFFMLCLSFFVFVLIYNLFKGYLIISILSITALLIVVILLTWISIFLYKYKYD